MPNIPWVYRALGYASIFLPFAQIAIAGPEGAVPRKGPSAYQVLTGGDADDDRERWDQIYRGKAFVFGTEPAELVREALVQIRPGRVLDIAMGEGRNAVFLASRGFRVEGVDYSNEALRKAKRLARERRVKIRTINADLNQYVIAPDSYDAILNIQYLQRSLIPAIKRGLKRGGFVVFEAALKTSEPVERSDLLSAGELRTLFSDFRILLYREIREGSEPKAQLIAQKP